MNMQPDEVKQYRSVANQALYAAIYVAEVHGDKSLWRKIARYFTIANGKTKELPQPLITDIKDNVVDGIGWQGRDEEAGQAFVKLNEIYQQNYRLINAWINR